MGRPACGRSVPAWKVVRARSERGPRSEERKGSKQAVGAAEVGEGRAGGEGTVGGRGDACILRPVICVLGEGQCSSQLTSQQAFFRAGKKGGILISKFWRRRRDHTHVLENRKEVMEAFARNKGPKWLLDASSGAK